MNSDEELLVMSKERRQLENVEVKLEYFEFERFELPSCINASKNPGQARPFYSYFFPNDFLCMFFKF